MKSICLIFMINLILVFTFSGLTEEDRERLPNLEERQRIEESLKKLQKLKKYLHMERRVLQEGDSSESESESESGESESESGESESESESESQPAGNQTEPEPVVTVTTTPEKFSEPTRTSKVILVSYNNFNAEKSPKKSRKDPNSTKEVYLIDFLMRLFFNIVGKVPEKVTVNLFVSSQTSLRSLQEKVSTPAECIIDPSDKGKDGNNSTIKYNCEAEAEVQPNVVGADEKLDLYEKENDAAPINDLSGEIEITPQAYVEATNLEVKTQKTSNFVQLNGKAEQKGDSIVISGTLDPPDSEELKNAKEIEFTFYDNSTTITSTDYEDRKRVMKCQVTKTDPKNYEITCNPDGSFQGSLHQKTGTTGGTSLMLNLEEGKEGVAIVKEAPSSDSDSTNTNTINRSIYRKSSSGLSGGSIAGIVIACAAALIIATILALVLKGPKVPANNHSSIVGLKSDDFQG